jgi:hypothetical protein
MNSIIG